MINSKRSSELTHQTDRVAGTATLYRALEILETLGDNPSGVTASRLAALTGVNRVTVHRILNTFKEFGFVRQNAPGSPYRLGFRFLALAERVVDELDLVRLGQSIVDQLAQETGESAYLAILDGAELLYVAKAESSRAVRVVSLIGLRVPLHSTALGKALLALLPPDAADALLATQTFEPRTERTIVDPNTLRAEFAAIRELGYAIDRGENETDVYCIATAVFDHNDMPIGALSIASPNLRISEDRFNELGRVVAKYARQLSASLGSAVRN